MSARKSTARAKPAAAPPAGPRPASGKDGDPPAPAGFPIVGIGASAGGLAAFEAFFSGMPVDTDPGMAFVLVQHLAPDYKSLLSDLIRRCTRMQVFEVEDGMRVDINCAYIIPPNRDMAFLHGALQLLEPSAPRGQRLPIDFFFRSLAQDQRERAIGIVLSGTGSDGTQGVRAIKGEAGMVMAQSLESTEFHGMPASACATGLVDYVLAPEAMPAQLISYARHAFGRGGRSVTGEASGTESALKKIFVLLRAQTGHDFSQYKPSTINRRIERRMAVHQIDVVDNYLRYLQQTPVEVEALFRDLLIGVTNFFRDPEAFLLLEEQVIPKLFEGKPSGAVIRVWSAGCSTGEEAYSIAILLQERIEALKRNYTVQFFATDIDSRAVATARLGRYAAGIAADVSTERLARFFTAESDGSGYRIHKSIRDMMVFSEQDVIKDPPFSKLDLISCRNLLIYLGVHLQRRMIPLFRYALKPGGFLFLGNSEGVGEFVEQFTVVDRKSKIYRREEALAGTPGARAGSLLPPAAAPAALPEYLPRKAGPAHKLPLREVAEQALLQQLASTAVLVDSHGDILYLHGRTGMYLEPAPGEVGTANILKMAREGLRRDLTIALHKVVGTGDVVQCPGLLVKTNSHFTRVNLTVCPVLPRHTAASEANLYLAILQDAPAPEARPAGDLPGAGAATDVAAGGALVDGGAQSQIAALKLALQARDDYLQSTQEELESSNEELKSSNEEMQSVNEELQSTNEELETSKEELQSVNEELGTVNAELQTKVVDLSRVNNDMSNLLAGTGIGTVFVDLQLRILRFTPAASGIINLVSSDVGRPLAHFASNLVSYDRLAADVQAVLDTLVPREVAVQVIDGRRMTMRILPYRTLDNVIEGAVITFVDITQTVLAEDALRQVRELSRLSVVLRDAHDAITVQDLEGRILAWNPGATRMFGWSEAEALHMNVRARIPQDLRDEALATLRRLSMAEVLEPYRTRRIDKQGRVIEVTIVSTALIDETGANYAIATTERAIREAGNERT